MAKEKVLKESTRSSALMGKSEKTYQAIIMIILLFCAFLCIAPFVMLVASSFTQDDILAKYGYCFWPRVFSGYAYKYIFLTNAEKVFRSYGVTLFVTVFGTALSLLVAPMLAWPLSRRDYPRAKVMTFVVFLTMLFNGGLVPSYMMWTQAFHVKNTIWALIFPTLLFNGFYIILFKNNFASNIHPALVEAARIDGAGEFYIYFKVVLPLSLPILATIGLMVALGYWNDWTNGLYYISQDQLYSLQQYLKSIIDNINAIASLGGTNGLSAADLPSTSIRMAIAVIGIIPILCLYPFFSKAFVSGIALGGVKE